MLKLKLNFGDNIMIISRMSKIIFGLPLKERDELFLNTRITNQNDLQQVSLENIKRGTLIYTLPSEKRYRNDNTYVYDGKEFHPFVSTNLDDYGMASSRMEIEVGEPINLLSTPEHNNYWWPCQEIRDIVKNSNFIQVNDAIKYCDIPSGDKIFRFICDGESNLDLGPYNYMQDRMWECESVIFTDEDVDISFAVDQRSNDENQIIIGDDIILCYIGSEVEEEEEMYDQED